MLWGEGEISVQNYISQLIFNRLILLCLALLVAGIPDPDLCLTADVELSHTLVMPIQIEEAGVIIFFS